MINISTYRFSNIFWDIVLETSEGVTEEVKSSFYSSSLNLENLRVHANYNTGSISISQAYLLYLVTKFFNPQKVIEVGTFIGRSTIAMAMGIESKRKDGEIHTCDSSNDILLPYYGSTSIIQYPRQTSVDMLKQLTSTFDFVFLDGRVQSEDLKLLDSLIHKDTVIALDDFEGMEKGVINLTYLRKLGKLKDYMLVYPATQSQLESNGLKGRSLLSLLIPRHFVRFTNQ